MGFLLFLYVGGKMGIVKSKIQNLLFEMLKPHHPYYGEQGLKGEGGCLAVGVAWTTPIWPFGVVNVEGVLPPMAGLGGFSHPFWSFKGGWSTPKWPRGAFGLPLSGHSDFFDFVFFFFFLK
jgi:hypothetical protein